LEQGHIQSINDPISMYLPDELLDHTDKADITIEDLLTMRSGINFNEVDDAAQILQELPGNTLEYILDLPMIYQPGQTYNYNSGDPHLIAASIQKSVGMPTDQWADDALFSQIGFSNYNWLRYDNYSFGGWGISTTPRELGKIAQLVLDRGSWNGSQVVDSLWIDEMIFSHIPSATVDNADFGYLWWIWNMDTDSLPHMAGSGGQYAAIVPDKQLLIVVMSEHDTDGDLELTSESFFEIVEDIISTVN